MINVNSKLKIEDIGCKNRCSDYTIDCNEVKDPAWCFLGLTVSTGMADGFCPFVHKSN